MGFAVFLAIFGRAATYSPKCPCQAENKTKPKTRFGTRQLQVSQEGRGDDLAGMGGFGDGISILSPGEEQLLCGEPDCMQ